MDVKKSWGQALKAPMPLSPVPSHAMALLSLWLEERGADVIGRSPSHLWLVWSTPHLWMSPQVCIAFVRATTTLPHTLGIFHLNLEGRPCTHFFLIPLEHPLKWSRNKIQNDIKPQRTRSRKGASRQEGIKTLLEERRQSMPNNSAAEQVKIHVLIVNNTSREVLEFPCPKPKQK